MDDRVDGICLLPGAAAVLRRRRDDRGHCHPCRPSRPHDDWPASDRRGGAGTSRRSLLYLSRQCTQPAAADWFGNSASCSGECEEVYGEDGWESGYRMIGSSGEVGPLTSATIIPRAL